MVKISAKIIKDNIIITFDGMFKANKFIGKIVDTVTGTTFTKRSTEKIKGADVIVILEGLPKSV